MLGVAKVHGIISSSLKELNYHGAGFVLPLQTLPPEQGCTVPFSVLVTVFVMRMSYHNFNAQYSL